MSIAPGQWQRWELQIASDPDSGVTRHHIPLLLLAKTEDRDHGQGDIVSTAQ